MDSGDVCPTEDALIAFFEYLVDPKLPLKPSARATPSPSNQESVAQQVHAVVLLYNYYHRRQHPDLEFLCFENFCKLAVVLRPALLGYMKLMQKSNDTELYDSEEQLSLTEKRIASACDISATLDASKDCPIIDGWPISKVAVLIVDSRKEKCLLRFSSMVEGVWSLIEKDVDFSRNINSEDGTDSKQTNKRRRIIRKPVREESGIGEASIQRLAFAAAKEASGINQTDLVVVESQVVYTISKEKAAARFYVMQCNQSNNNDVAWHPLKDAIDSLQGPLLARSNSCWMITAVVEYFHLLPYARAITDWFSRVSVCNSLDIQTAGLKTMMVSGFNSSGSNTSSGLLKQNTDNGYLGSQGNSDFLKNNDNDGFCIVGSGDFDVTQNLEVDHSSMVHTQNEDKCRNMYGKIHPNKCQMTSDQKSLIDSTSDDKLGGMAESRDENGVNKKNCYDVGSDEDGLSLMNQAFHTSQSGSKDFVKVHAMLASKEKELSQVALRVLLSKRDKLLALKDTAVQLGKLYKLSYLPLQSFQQRDIEEQIAQCDKSIQQILNGAEEDLALKIESIIEVCNDVCLRSLSREKAIKDQRSPESVNRMRLSEADARNFCQELDDLCYENDWVLPSYHVVSVDGGYRASVHLKGIESELSYSGDIRSQVREARASAAAKMLAKLLDPSNQFK